MKRTGLAIGAVIFAVVAGYIPFLPYSGPCKQAGAQAQNLGQRTVAGRVVMGADDQPVAAATVFLKNLKTKAIRSYSTDEKGHYRFTQVNMVEDHELWAEKDGKKSAVKSVSSWDTRKEFDTELKLK